MADDNTTLVRTAFEAFVAGDAPAVLELVDSDLEWTFLDPSEEDPIPRVCHARRELARRMGRGSLWQNGTELEELTPYGERVLVVTHSPGIDTERARKTGDRNFHVVSVRDGRIVALRACRSHDEARAVASAT